MERCFVRNVDFVASNCMDEQAVITEDGNHKEEIQEASKSVKIQEVVEVGQKTDISGYTSSTISARVHKFFPGMGWFAGNIGGIRQDNDRNIDDILFKDDDTEKWR